MFLLALCPILWLIFALTVLKWPTWKAACGSMIVSFLLAMLVWKLPFMHALTAGLEGILMALWPIVVVIIAAVFTYNLTVRTGAMDVIKQMMTSVTNDKRLLVLLVAWCFGGFMEGMAGFGTAIAIPASMLVGLGFPACFPVLYVCLPMACRLLLAVLASRPLPWPTWSDWKTRIFPSRPRCSLLRS